MAPRDLVQSVHNLDQRLGRVEQILPTLATKQDLEALATKEEVRREGEETRRYMKVLVEELKGEDALYAENVTAVDERLTRLHAESVEADRALDKRVMALEAARSRRRRG